MDRKWTDWINNCNWEHSGDSRYGENLWGSYGTAEPSDVATAVVSWQGEEAYWSCQNNQCNAPSGSSCGHFTQVMWDSSTQVGCAMVSGCKPGTDNVHVIIMCNYYPPGNDGSRPFSCTHVLTSVTLDQHSLTLICMLQCPSAPTIPTSATRSSSSTSS